jgi:hypothetical protein
LTAKFITDLTKPEDHWSGILGAVMDRQFKFNKQYFSCSFKAFVCYDSSVLSVAAALWFICSLAVYVVFRN